MCEAVTRDSKSWWTIDGGYCLPYPLAYQTLGLDTTAVIDLCTFFLKCALSDSLNQDCPCKDINDCRKAINDLCMYVYLSYPGSGLLLSPFVDMLYDRDRDWTNNKPDAFMYYGKMKCIGYELIKNDFSWVDAVPETFSFYGYRALEAWICDLSEEFGAYRNYSGSHYDVNCWNNSKTFNNRSYQVSFLCKTRCISKYRVRDGIWDCYLSEEFHVINNSCPQIQRHRLQCSPSELTCLLAGALRIGGTFCSNRRDEFDHEPGSDRSNILLCERRNDPRCVYIRNYIRISSYNDTSETTIANNSILDGSFASMIPFRLYCNSFFNLGSGVDESLQFCKEWICFNNEYQCLSGQCISPRWICDGTFTVLTICICSYIFTGEWDCSDGSDEQRIFIMNELSEHNSKLMNLTEIKQRCYERYRLNNTAFSDICNISTEYPCFRTDNDDPFNLTLNRPCINLTQIGDGKTDCLSNLDERNRVQCSNLGMLGFNFQLNDNLCAEYVYVCTQPNYLMKPGTNIAYDTVCFYHKTNFTNGTVSNCNSFNDVMCLNDVCIKNARCNGKIECLHGEDEYRCMPQGMSQVLYRDEKRWTLLSAKLGQWKYPSSTQILQINHADYHIRKDSSLYRIVDTSEVKSVYTMVRDSLQNGPITFEKHYLPFICNRGLAVKYYTGDTVCFCPPSFYGSKCEFYSDRITVTTHLDLTNYNIFVHHVAIIKVLTTFLFKDQIIDYFEFHVNPQIQTNENYVKQGIYFLYPRLQEFIQMKKINRSGVQFYTVRFEAFSLHLNETIQPIGVWKYPIYFDFLPSFRLSKILRFNPPISTGPCSNHSCGENGICQEVMNSNHSSYFCSCNNAYYGIRCEHYDEKCNDYCSSKSICKPKYSGMINGNEEPFCLCSAARFGKRCYFKNDNCRNNPCLNEGSCIVTYDLTDTNNYTCLCTDSFSGNHREFPKGMVEIKIMLSSNSTLQTTDVIATTVSYNDYHDITLHSIVRHQQVYGTLPQYLKLMYNDKLSTYAPTAAIMKVYGSNYYKEEPKYYVLYFYFPRQREINITIDLTLENHCPFVQISGKLEYFSHN
jgi:hypothetical protein